VVATLMEQHIMVLRYVADVGEAGKEGTLPCWNTASSSVARGVTSSGARSASAGERPAKASRCWVRDGRQGVLRGPPCGVVASYKSERYLVQ
jgi:hypothetical protein